jgi:hypothetical protein
MHTCRKFYAASGCRTIKPRQKTRWPKVRRDLLGPKVPLVHPERKVLREQRVRRARWGRPDLLALRAEQVHRDRRGLRARPGAQGPQGAAGPQGPQGPPAAGGIAVFDSKGAIVGKPLGYNPTINNSLEMLMSIIGTQVVTLVDDSASSATGFRTVDVANNYLIFYHNSADCSGPRYLYNGGQLSAFVAVTVNSQTSPIYLYYPSSAPQQMALFSAEIFQAGHTPDQPGTCQSGFNQTLPMSIPTHIDMTTLGFAPPFHFQ